MKILLLNVSYEPLRLISLEDAICKVYSNEVYLEGEQYFSVAGGVNHFGDRSNVVLSHVIRNKSYDKASSRQVPFNRKLMFFRDSYSCAYCKRKGKNIDLTHDHIIPKATLHHKGLLNKIPHNKRHLITRQFINGWENAVTSCKKCNNKKGSNLHGVFNKDKQKKPSIADVIYLKSNSEQRNQFAHYIHPFLKVSQAYIKI